MADKARKRVFVVGVGMTKFSKPGSTGMDYPDLVKEAVTTALGDCGLKYTDVEQAAVGYIYGSSCSAQRALYAVGMTGIPIYNVNNACASGSTALFMMKQFIETGNTDVGLAVGFEKMARGSLENMGGTLTDRALPAEFHIDVMSNSYGLNPAPITAQMFGMAGKEHMEKYGTKPEHFIKIAQKNHKHSVHNDNAQFQKEYTFDQVKNSKQIYDFLTLLQCSPTSDGAAAVIVCSERYLEDNPRLKDRAVEILGMQLGSDVPTSFSEGSNIKMVGYDIIRERSQKLYEETGLTPKDVQVIELHDCFAPNELITYEALGLCPVGKGGELVDRGDNTYGGKWVINPSGGLISKGHPIGATGVAQVVELSKHLRGEAGMRQVDNCRVAMQHNIGIGSAGVVAMYKLAYPKYGFVTKRPTAALTNTTATKKEQTTSTSGFLSDRIFQEIQQKSGGPGGAELARKVNCSFRFVLTGGPEGATKKWTVDLTKSPVFVGQREGKVDVELTMKDADMVLLAQGKMRPDQAFMGGKLKMKGNMAKAMKLKDVLDPSKLQAKL